MFFGIIIRMYFAPKEHNPPHIHAIYENFEATFDIDNGDLINGDMPRSKIKLINAWVEIHKEELMADWVLCQNGELPFKIEGLK